MLFLDVETKHLYYETSEIRDTSDLEVSFVGAYDSVLKKYFSFWEKDISDLGKMINNADRVVGYNSWAFDYAVLQPYLDFNIWKVPSLDLMIAMKKLIGFRPKLDDLARANLGITKLGKGVDAVSYWKSGELKKLEEYCLEDVRITYEIWNKGDKQRKLSYYDKDGFLKELEIDWKIGFVQKSEPNQISML